MNTIFSIALRPQHHRFIPLFFKMLSTHPLQTNVNPKLPFDLITLGSFLRSSKPNSFAINQMLPVFARVIHHYKTHQTILSKLVSIGSINLSTININPNPFINLLRIFSRSGNHELLIKTCDYMVEFHGFQISSKTFASNLLMESLFKASQPKNAFKIFGETRSPNFLTFNIALFHLSNFNDIVNVKYVLREMLRLRYCPNASTFSAVLNAFCKMNAFRQVYQILGLMIGLGIELSVNVWTVLIHHFCKLGKLDVADDLFDKMIQSCCSPNSVTYTPLIKAVMESDDVTLALRLEQKMNSVGIVPDLVFYNMLIDCLSKSGMHEEAIRVFEQKNFKPDKYTFTSLLSAICRSEQFDLLPKLVQHCKHISRDLVFCNALLISYVKAGYSSRALELYERMISEGFKPDKYTFAGLLSALCAENRNDEAVKVWRAVTMDHTDDVHIHTVISNELKKAGQYEQASDVFISEAVKKYPLDSIAYGVGIDAHLRSGRTLEARTLYDQMKKNGLEPNFQTFNMILFRSLEVKDLQMVKQLLQDMIDSRIKLSDRNFFNLRKFQCNWNLLTEMRDLGLLSSKVLHTENVKANSKHCAEVDTECNSSSEDMSDVAVSVC
ncbi:putative tetratricopeptide-like helical domain-containing protein [Medicago truncatula]|uniref:Putative tetratricopeptide-like helical domain-containing protein n=1 Tax=Medicago truncatula TaxID=3880 RepID=A0A396H128_MEDTR|nr:putative pentatricopeptide repeat-containing protein At1g16830 [Medicago truncatula]XP_024627281.1 putative pentatricopeptide repeat-containing protein At1g16830 [Medicago truncatula]XP_024627282.1 putative pentatricopeptide repeat-containing protein At1g16830 [Medicago truncatula]XP_024627283.1 putative pentatricopeptide repeat-containing protein At1g16830 [Medicago truncatula]XP_024627284.1 putative pentatricopeptide repeat-containing protein At1g16830 [Medicago truncatula]XP_024627285.1 